MSMGLCSLVTAVGSLTACITPAPTPPPPLTYRLTNYCPAPASHHQQVLADQLNRIIDDSDLPAWQAGDIGASARLSDGRLAWVFADTLRKDTFKPRLVANSILLTSGNCVTQLIVPAQRRARDPVPQPPDCPVAQHPSRCSATTTPWSPTALTSSWCRALEPCG